MVRPESRRRFCAKALWVAAASLSAALVAGCSSSESGPPVDVKTGANDRRGPADRGKGKAGKGTSAEGR
jgi:hypothetical protein